MVKKLCKTNEWMDTWTEGWKDRRTDRQTDRQTKPVEIHGQCKIENVKYHINPIVFMVLLPK